MPFHTGLTLLNFTDNMMEAFPQWEFLPGLSRFVVTKAVSALKPVRGVHSIFGATIGRPVLRVVMQTLGHG